jgi:hypothetical protein
MYTVTCNFRNRAHKYLYNLPSIVMIGPKVAGMLLLLTVTILISSSSQLVTGQNTVLSAQDIEPEESDVFIFQNTSMSEPAPVRHPGQPPHEIVFALPLRDDGMIWSGKVTFTASKPIEVEVLHLYNPQQNVDEEHGEPYHAVLPGNRSVAISHFRDLVEVPLEINGTAISTGTIDFVGSALLFHKTNGEPFTVSYSVDAVARNATY